MAQAREIGIIAWKIIKNIMLLAPGAAVLSGCAKSPESIAPSYVK
ncbi:MAG: hypothetical protein WAM29_02755 [Methylocella sp.]